MAKRIKPNLVKKMQVTFGLERIITGKFFYQIPKIKLESIYQINYHVTPKFVADEKQSQVSVRLTIEGTILESKEEVISMESLFIFSIKELDKYLMHKDGLPLFATTFQPVLSSLIGICLSTSRGILLEKLHGTIYANKILPIMNPNIFFEKLPV